jgi:P-type Ca2+ transporter type 2B
MNDTSHCRCTSIIGENNQQRTLDDNEKIRLTHDIIENMASNGLRTICIAYKDLGKQEQSWNDEDKFVSNLTCIAIVGIEDPVRDEVRSMCMNKYSCSNNCQLGTSSY